MRHIVRSNASNDLSQTIEIERIKLEASVNAEIALVLKMAGSALIQRYFADPADLELEDAAFAEIAGYRRALASNSVFWVNDVDKGFYSDDTYAYTVDTSDPNNYWYLMTLNETEKYNFNINYNPDLQKTNLWINAPVFDSGHTPIGILGTGIDLSAFIDSIYKNYDGRAELYFFNAAGEITGARDASLVAEKHTIAEVLDETGAEIAARAENLPAGETETFLASRGETALSAVPSLGWYIAAVQPFTAADYLNTPITFLFLAMTGVILAIFVIVNVFITGLLNPLGKMVETLNDISTDWDLTRRLEVRQKDEIGTLAAFFNLTFEKIREMIQGIKVQAFSLSDTGEELTANMSQTAAAIETINANIRNMREQVITQTGEVEETADATGRIIERLDKLNSHIAVQSESVAQSSSAIEEMLASIHSVTETLVKNTGNINSLAESSETGRTDLQKVSADIQEIAKESEGLLQINSVMQNIASQTNLLSMNAAIEAAHAGESGQGFAVVAGEIRKLAENSGIQSKTISTVLKKIKTSIDAITKSTGVVLERFELIEQEVKTVSGQEAQIRAAMEEQEIGSRHILEAVTQLNAVTDLVQTASRDMTEETREVLKQSEDLQRISGEVAGSMDEMNGSAEQINSTVNRVNEISQENEQNITALNGEIARFKVGE
jgi:methyl-accepting chemotaxis protein